MPIWLPFDSETSILSKFSLGWKQNLESKYCPKQLQNSPKFACQTRSKNRTCYTEKRIQRYLLFYWCKIKDVSVWIKYEIKNFKSLYFYTNIFSKALTFFSGPIICCVRLRYVSSRDLGHRLFPSDGLRSPCDAITSSFANNFTGWRQKRM